MMEKNKIIDSKFYSFRFYLNILIGLLAYFCIEIFNLKLFFNSYFFEIIIAALILFGAFYIFKHKK